MMKLSTYACLKEVLFGQLALQNGQTNAKQVPAALVDRRGVYDAVARSSSSCLGSKEKKYGLEALALKQSLVECGTVIRWCHSAAQLVILKKTLVHHVLLGNCSSVADFGGS